MQFQISARCSIIDPVERRRRLAQLYRIFETKVGQVDRVSEAQTTRPTEHRISKPIQPGDYTTGPAEQETRE